MKMSISMGFMKPVSGFIKKYMALLPSIGITVVALLLLVPTMLIGKSVKKEMSNSISMANNVKRLLSDVPPREKPEQKRRYMNALEEEVFVVEQMALQSCQRELISYDIFPEPKYTSSQIFPEFGALYRTAVESLIDRINALDAPSDAEIRAETGGGARVGDNSLYGAPVMRRTTDAADPMIDALCKTRAQEISVYAHPTVFAWYNFWQDYTFEGQDKALEDCWDSQVAFWIYEDIIQTVDKINTGSESVFTSPVKRLLGVSFSGPVMNEGNAISLQRGYGAVRALANRDKPNYVTALKASNFMVSSPTERIGNEDMDIIHFAVSVLVDNRSVMSFLQELCTQKEHQFREGFQADGKLVNAKHNQITILKSDISLIDKQSPEHELYRYGNTAVMRLDLICEYQFYRKSYDGIKPKQVKVLLGQQDADQGTTGTPGGPQPPQMFF